MEIQEEEVINQHKGIQLYKELFPNGERYLVMEIEGVKLPKQIPGSIRFYQSELKFSIDIYMDTRIKGSITRKEIEHLPFQDGQPKFWQLSSGLNGATVFFDLTKAYYYE